MAKSASADLIGRRHGSGGAGNIRGNVRIAGRLKYSALALDLIPRAVICGIERVSITNLEVALGEINFAVYSRILVCKCDRNRMAVGTCQMIGERHCLS